MKKSDKTIKEFEAYLNEVQYRFQAYWNQEQKKNPDLFPVMLPMEEWLEQFLIFLDSDL